MIISKTPLRIGFCGGGSDLPTFNKNNIGCCINATIDKYIYILVKKRYDDKIYLKYSQNEIVDVNTIDSIEHDLIRETLKYVGIDFGLEIINFADIPTQGTGLGSSSSFLVGLLNALYTLIGRQTNAFDLSTQACDIEIDLCKKPIGYQDQFAAGYGGFNKMCFFDGTPYKTNVFKFDFNDKELTNLSSYLMAFYTGTSRNSSTILQHQKDEMNNSDIEIEKMQMNVDLAYELDTFLMNKDFDKLGVCMHKNWIIKKQFSDKISNPLIDQMYDTALNCGATGGKITGAGGGGFLILYVPLEHQTRVKENLLEIDKQIKYMPINIDKFGSRILLNTESNTW